VDGAGPATAQALPELEPGGERISARPLAFHRDQAGGVDGTKVRVVAELLLALRAKFHRLSPL